MMHETACSFLAFLTRDNKIKDDEKKRWKNALDIPIVHQSYVLNFSKESSGERNVHALLKIF